MILLENGHWRSVRTSQEGTSLLEKDLENLTADERAVIEMLLRELTDPVGSSDLLSTIGNLEWTRTPVDMQTFVMDPYYLGNTCDNLYPKLLDDLVTLFEEGYREAIFTGAIGWGKCLKSDGFFVDGISGCRVLIGDAADQGRMVVVPSLDETGRISHQAVAKVWASGQKECARLLLRSGQYIEASLDHPVLTARGYRALGGLVPGELVAAARWVPAPQSCLEMGDNEVALLGALISDGGFRGPTVTYTKNKSLAAQVEQFCADVPGFNGVGYRHVAGSTCQMNLRGLRGWAERWGLWGVHSRHKRVPAELFGLNDRQLAIFLRWVFTDGNVYTKSPRKIEICLASEKLIDDLQYLLRRFGIVARKSHREKLCQGQVFDAWRLQIGDAPAQLAFLDRVGFIPGKEAACDRLRVAISSVVSNPNWDIVPVGYEELKEIRRETGPHEKKKWARLAGLQKGSWMGRAKFFRLCDEIGYRGKYFNLAQADVVWEPVAAVDRIGVHDVYDLTVPETQNAVVNGIVVHNTFAASIGICRLLYILSCMKDPHRSFGIAANSNISIVCLSVNEILATKVAYENIATKIEASPYFQEHFPFEKTKKELRFPRHVWVAARASNDGSVLGLNVIGGLLDETNFMPKATKGQDPRFNLQDRAEVLYNAMQRRMKSRFERKGRLPGILFVVSSKQTNADFTAKRIQESALDPTVFVRDYALWQVKPDIYYSGDWFHVVVGNEQAPSRIVADDEDIDEVRVTLPEDCIVVDVPEDFKGDFEKDMEGAIRDLAGVATVAVSPYIQRRTKIIDAIRSDMKHPFSTEVYDPSQPGRFYWNQMVRPDLEFEGGNRPILNSHAPRHIHIDPSLNGDATGLAMGHISGWREVIRRDDDGNKYPERAPEITVDFVLRIVPPTGGEIILGDVRRLVYELSKHGYMITCVSIDSWNSADAIQKLAQRGFNAIQLSVDRTMGPYDLLKMALYEDRLFYYDYPLLLQELRELEHDRVKRKVDHPLRGKKDVADAVAGIVWTLTENSSALPLPMLRSMPSHGDAWMLEHQQAAMAGNYGGVANTRDFSDWHQEHSLDFGNLLPPFLVGSGSGDEN